LRKIISSSEIERLSKMLDIYKRKKIENTICTRLSELVKIEKMLSNDPLIYIHLNTTKLGKIYCFILIY